jgi:hypothetical protein
VQAAVAVARAHGLRPTDPSVIADDTNVLVHLRPAPVVARVVTTMALIRPEPGEFLAREVRVAGWLAAHGAPVVAPTDELPPGPHTRDGFEMTFWRFVETRRDVPEVSEVASALAGLHRLLEDFPHELPYLSPALDEVQRMLDFCGTHRLLEPLDLQELRTAHAALEPALASAPDRARPLHGDAHAWNLLLTADGMLWSDFEDTCRGPVEWDLACLVRASTWSDEVALDAYGYDGAREKLEPFIEARSLQGILWTAVIGHRVPAHRERAQDRLRAWRGGR